MCRLLTTFFSFLIFQPLFAQDYVDMSSSNSGTFELQSNIKGEALAPVGSPFLNENWEPGTIDLADGKIMEIEKMNFNSHKGVICYMKNNVVYNSSKDLDVTKFNIGNQLFLSHSVNGEKLYLQVLVQGDKMKLLKESYTDFIPGTASKGYVAAEPPKYVAKANFYVQPDGEAPYAIKAKKKEILKVLSDKEDEIKDFISTNSLNIKEERGLMQVFDYYNLISGDEG
ncbi:MAG: hypothetical protein ABJG41_00925 [Cyclobacteriaceae bacterium]